MTQTFGLEVNDYNILLKASSKYNPSSSKVDSVRNKYPKLSYDDAIIVLKLINSPVRNTFTVYDIISYLKK
jgi:hypothetical protein